MTIVPGWHPMVVHFPLALGVTAAVFLAAARLVRRERLMTTLAIVGTWNLCLSAIAAVLALATGLSAALGLDVSAAAHQTISTHLKWAVVTTFVLVFLAVWRGAGSAQDSRPSWGLVAVSLMVAAALIATGYRGAQNVYRFGIGVHRVQ